MKPLGMIHWHNFHQPKHVQVHIKISPDNKRSAFQCEAYECDVLVVMCEEMRVQCPDYPDFW